MDLEEPGWPASLTPKTSPVEMFASAFAQAANTNLKKQALERELAQMNANMVYKQQAHDLDMKQFQWKQGMDIANLNRQASTEQRMAVYQDRMAGAAEDRVNLTLGLRDANEQNASKYQDELQALAQKYPDSYANQEFANELSLVNQKFNTVAGTKEGGRVWSQFQSQIGAAQKQGHWSADQIRKNFMSSITGQSQGGRGFGAEDYNRPEDAFREIDGKKVITEYPIMVPGTTTVGQWATIPPDDPRLKLPESEQTAQGIRSRSVPVNTYNSTKALHDTMLKIGGPDLSQKPADLSSTVNEVTRTTADGRQAVFDSSTKKFIRWAE